MEILNLFTKNYQSFLNGICIYCSFLLVSNLNIDLHKFLFFVDSSSIIFKNIEFNPTVDFLLTTDGFIFAIQVSIILFIPIFILGLFTGVIKSFFRFILKIISTNSKLNKLFESFLSHTENLTDSELKDRYKDVKKELKTNKKLMNKILLFTITFFYVNWVLPMTVIKFATFYTLAAYIYYLFEYEKNIFRKRELKIRIANTIKD